MTLVFNVHLQTCSEFTCFANHLYTGEFLQMEGKVETGQPAYPPYCNRSRITIILETVNIKRFSVAQNLGRQWTKPDIASCNWSKNAIVSYLQNLVKMA